MKLSLALDQFDSLHPKFTLADRQKIYEVVTEMKLLEADFIGDVFLHDANWQSYSDFSQIESDRIFWTPCPFPNDLIGTIRIHPTMIVAKKSFTGSSDRGEYSPYSFHWHHYELSKWIDKNSSNLRKKIEARQVLCPKLLIRVAAGFECQCGEIHH